MELLCPNIVFLMACMLLLFVRHRGRGMSAPSTGGRGRELSVYSSYRAFDEKLNRGDVDNSAPGFARAMALAANDILSIRLAREVSYRLSRAVRFHVATIWAVLFLILLSPLISFLPYLLGFGHACGGTLKLSTHFRLFLGSPWVLYFTFLHYWLLVWPTKVWSEFVRIGDKIEAMFVTTDDKAQFERWMGRRLKLLPQILLSLFFGVAGVFAAWVEAHHRLGRSLVQPVHFCPAPYISAFITGTLGANAVYWIWVQTQLVRRLSRFPSLVVTWNAPVNTPGIRELAHLVASSVVRSLVGLLYLMIPVVWVFFSDERGLALLVVEVFVSSISLGIFIALAVLPQRWFNKIIYREKHKVLDQLSAEIATSRGEDHWSDVETKTNIYKTINATRNTILDIETVTRYAIAVFTAILTAILPFIIRWLIKTPSQP